MGELFTKYYRLQEVNRNLEAKLLQSPKSTQAKPGVSISEQHMLDAKADTKVAVVSELLEVPDCPHQLL